MDDQIPNAARIYNYTLGGEHYTAADAAAAEAMFALVPSTRKWVGMLRSFLQHAAQQLWDEGFTHFVDFASGLPTEEHVHGVLPEARVIYSDNDPSTVAAAREMVAGRPNVLYVQHDIRQARALLDKPEVKRFLAGAEKVAIGLNGITVFLGPQEIRALFQDLYAWAPPGSKVYITYETKDPDLMTPAMDEFIGMFRAAGAPFWMYSLEESIAMSQPWKLPPGGLMPLREYLGLPEDALSEADYEGVGLQFYAAILEKPASVE